MSISSIYFLRNNYNYSSSITCKSESLWMLGVAIRSSCHASFDSTLSSDSGSSTGNPPGPSSLDRFANPSTFYAKLWVSDLSSYRPSSRFDFLDLIWGGISLTKGSWTSKVLISFIWSSIPSRSTLPPFPDPGVNDSGSTESSIIGF